MNTLLSLILLSLILSGLRSVPAPSGRASAWARRVGEMLGVGELLGVIEVAAAAVEIGRWI